MTISEQIRAVALGPTPRWGVSSVSDWFRYDTKAWRAICDFQNGYGVFDRDATYTDIHMFLLLCAEALESETA